MCVRVMTHIEPVCHPNAALSRESFVLVCRAYFPLCPVVMESASANLFGQPP